MAAGTMKSGNVGVFCTRTVNFYQFLIDFRFAKTEWAVSRLEGKWPLPSGKVRALHAVFTKVPADDSTTVPADDSTKVPAENFTEIPAEGCRYKKAFTRRPSCYRDTSLIRNCPPPEPNSSKSLWL